MSRLSRTLLAGALGAAAIVLPATAAAGQTGLPDDDIALDYCTYDWGHPRLDGDAAVAAYEAEWLARPFDRQAVVVNADGAKFYLDTDQFSGPSGSIPSRATIASGPALCASNGRVLFPVETPTGMRGWVKAYDVEEVVVVPAEKLTHVGTATGGAGDTTWFSSRDADTAMNFYAAPIGGMQPSGALTVGAAYLIAPELAAADTSLASDMLVPIQTAAGVQWAWMESLTIHPVPSVVELTGTATPAVEVSLYGAPNTELAAVGSLPAGTAATTGPAVAGFTPVAFNDGVAWAKSTDLTAAAPVAAPTPSAESAETTTAETTPADEPATETDETNDHDTVAGWGDLLGRFTSGLDAKAYAGGPLLSTLLAAGALALFFFPALFVSNRKAKDESLQVHTAFRAVIEALGFVGWVALPLTAGAAALLAPATMPFILGAVILGALSGYVVGDAVAARFGHDGEQIVQLRKLHRALPSSLVRMLAWGAGVAVVTLAGSVFTLGFAGMAPLFAGCTAAFMILARRSARTFTG